MRKSGLVAAGLGSLVLLLSACGGSGSSNSAANSTSTSASQSTSASASASSASASASGSSSNGATTLPTPKPHHTAGPQPSSNLGSIPPVGTTVLAVRESAIGWVLAEASGYVVYIYDKDPKGGTPTCTGACNSTWAPVTGMPQVSPADHIPGVFALVTTPSGKKQITYNGMPLYTYKLAGRLVTTGNGIGGVWHVVKMSASYVG